MTNLPSNGDIIIFDRVPNASYARIGEAYKVSRSLNHRGDINLTSIARGSSTMDRPSTYRHAIWHLTS